MLRGKRQNVAPLPAAETKAVFRDYGFTDNSDDAVDFTEDLVDEKEVLSRLKGMVAHDRGRSGSSSSQEDIRVHSKKKSRKTPMTAVHETSKNCSEHEEEEVLYWCKEDQVMVCKECLIFGKHRLHTPLKDEEMRMAKLAYTLTENAKYLENEILKSQDMIGNLICQGEDQFNSTKETTLNMLDMEFEKAKIALVPILSKHCAKLQKVSDKLKAGVEVEPDLVDKLVCHPLQAHLTPGSIAWQGEKLVVTPPMFCASYDTDFSSQSYTAGAPVVGSQSSQLQTSLPTSQFQGRNILASQIEKSSQIGGLEVRTLPITSKPQDRGQSSSQLLEEHSVTCESSKQDLDTSQFKVNHGLAGQRNNKYLQLSKDPKSTLSDELPKKATFQGANSEELQSSVEESCQLPTTVTAQLHRVPECHDNITRIKTPDITTLAGRMVSVTENGNPANFYCKLVDSADIDKLLSDADDTVVLNPTVGQGVLVRHMGSWCRARLLGCHGFKWRCELVDKGQVLEGVSEMNMTYLPPEVVEIPAMTVKCSLAGMGDNGWDENVIIDWSRLVQDRQFLLTVVDDLSNTVELSEGCVSLVSRLVFLGHTPPPSTPYLSQQHYEYPSHLSTTATLCCDYQDISPHSILLYFDNPLHEDHVNMLDQLNDQVDLVGPPGYVEEGCAVIAPWEGKLYRCVVLSTQGSTLTVLYVDHGNIDRVSWWDCFEVPSTFLFPTLATQVRLARVSTEGGQWNPRGRELLYNILDSSQGVEVIIVESKDKMLTVELKVGRGKRREDVGELLVGNGYAEFDLRNSNIFHKEEVEMVKCQTTTCLAQSEKSSISSSVTLMSNFLEREEDCCIVDTEKVVQDTPAKDESLPVTDKVILVGKFDKMKDRVLILPIIKKKWEGVRHVKDFINEIEIFFVDRSYAEKCLKSASPVVLTFSSKSFIFEAYPDSVCHYSGLFVTCFPTETSYQDLMDHFSDFGEILLIKGPFATRLNSTARAAVVVFRYKSSMISAYDKASRKIHGQTFVIKRSKPKTEDDRAPVPNVAGDEQQIVDNEDLKSSKQSIMTNKENLISIDDAYIPTDQGPNISPLLPKKQVFTAMLMSIDSKAVVWVVPEYVEGVLTRIKNELEVCVENVGDIIPGIIVIVIKDKGEKLRGRVLEELDNDVVEIVDIDSGVVSRTSRLNLRQASPILLYTPPLAIPLKLYGVRKTSHFLNPEARYNVFDKIKRSLNGVWCTVSIIERHLKELPLPANVRYTVSEEHDGNIALDLLELGVCEMMTNFSQWEVEMADNGLDWMLDPMAGPHSMAFMPNPLPLAVGQWVPVSVEGLEYPLVGGLEQDPDITTPDANRIGVQVRRFPANSTFDNCRSFGVEICSSLSVLDSQVLKLAGVAEGARLLYAKSAMNASQVDSPTVGQSVLVFYKMEDGGEWCRGTVETVKTGGVSTIHFTDYGHRGQATIGQIKSLGYRERMMPVQIIEVLFSMPRTNSELEAVRHDLSQAENMMMRVESITPLGHPRELEEVLVSVWRVLEGEGEERYLLSRIC